MNVVAMFNQCKQNLHNYIIQNCIFYVLAAFNVCRPVVHS